MRITGCRQSLLAAAVVGWLFCGLGSEKASAVEIIGHRGSSHIAPENTLASIKLAWSEQAEGAEIDVWLTADKKIAVSHDNSLQRITGRPGKITEMRLDELEQIDVGAWKGPQWAGQHIPSLEAVLAAIPDGKQLFVEIKSGAEILDEFTHVVQASGKTASQIVVISFHLDVVKGVKERMPELAVYWLRAKSPRQDTKTGKWLDKPEEILETCRKEKLNGLDLESTSELTREYVDKIHGLGMKVYVWTVDLPEEARKLVELGVDGVTTNRPGWMKEQLRMGIAN
jgi:glycerophosphoryl diester phosphodiesterase